MTAGRLTERSPCVRQALHSAPCTRVLSSHNSPVRAHATVITGTAGTRIYREIGMDVF